MFDVLWLDVRLAVRSLLKRPLVTVVAVLSLALGIGVNTAIFSVFERLLLRPLPVPAPEEIVVVRGIAGVVMAVVLGRLGETLLFGVDRTNAGIVAAGGDRHRARRAGRGGGAGPTREHRGSGRGTTNGIAGVWVLAGRAFTSRLRSAQP